MNYKNTNKKRLCLFISIAFLSFLCGVLLEHNRSKITSQLKYAAYKKTQTNTSTLDRNDIFNKLTAQFQPKWTFAGNSNPETVRNNILECVRELFPVSKKYRVTQEKTIDERLNYFFLESPEGIDTKLILGIPQKTHVTSKAILIVDDEGSVEEIFDLPVKKRKGGRSIGISLLNAGHIVCAVELKGFGYSRLPDSWWGQHGIYRWYTILKSNDIDLLSLHVRNSYDALQLLKDKGKNLDIGLCGISKAVSRIGILAALDPSVKYVYAASGLSMYEDKYYSDVSHAYLKGQRKFFNYNDLFGALIGKKVRLSYGKKENLTYATEANNLDTFNYIKDIFERFGGKADITAFVHDSGHIYIKEDVVSFFNN